MRWAVRVAADSLDRLAELARATNLSPGQIVVMAFEGLATGRPSQLREYIAAHRGLVDNTQLLRWRAWRFDVTAVTVVRAEQLAKEFRVTRQVLVTLVIDCLTQGWGDGGKRTSVEELLRIIYTAAPTPALAAAGGLNSAEASTA